MQISTGLIAGMSVTAAVLSLSMVRAEKAFMTDTKGSEAAAHEHETPPSGGEGLETATFGAGCFWCVEAVFQQIEGVHSVVSGYTGGQVANPTYEQVCSGTTGHAEVAQITFDPAVVSYTELLEVFWKTHDPMTLNRQGNDVGTQYRSAIFYHNDQQQKLAEHYKQQLENAGVFGRPIVTEIAPLEKFYPAEGYHQNYYQLNSQQSYCTYVIAPKVEKVQQVFRDKLKRR